MNSDPVIRPLERADLAAWRVLWDGYNAFYGRVGAAALPESITKATWDRFFDDAEPVHATVAEWNGCVVGLAHFLFHRSTTRLNDVCYLQDLFTAPEVRGRGVGRRLIESVYRAAAGRHGSRVYWTTQTDNVAGRALYEQVATHRGFIVYSHDLA